MRTDAAADATQKGVHPELGVVTLRQHLATWAVHDHDHVAQIYSALAGSHDADVRPWKAYLGILLRRDREWPLSRMSWPIGPSGTWLGHPGGVPLTPRRRSFSTHDEGGLMSGYSVDIERATLENDDFRRVLYTAPHSQVVVMSIEPGGEIGMERHDTGDQFIRVEEGEGEAILDGERHELGDGTALVIPSGTEHNVINTSRSDPLRLYTVYSPAQHPDGTVHRTKAEADAAEHAHATS